MTYIDTSPTATIAVRPRSEPLSTVFDSGTADGRAEVEVTVDAAIEPASASPA